MSRTVAERMHDFGVTAVAEKAARRHRVTLSALLSSSRFAPLVNARRELYAALRVRGLSYPLIGYLTGRDHTTIMHALGARPLKRGKARRQ